MENGLHYHKQKNNVAPSNIRAENMKLLIYIYIYIKTFWLLDSNDMSNVIFFFLLGKQIPLSRSSRNFGIPDSDDDDGLGDDGGPDGEVPDTFCDYSLRYIHISHPIRRMCISICSNP